MFRFTILGCMFVVVAAAASVRAEVRPERTSPAAESLLVSATRRLATGEFAQQRFALGELEEAMQLAPRDARIALAAGRAYVGLGHLARARRCFEAAARLSPHDARPLLGLADAARREWLTDLDSLAFDRALRALVTAAERMPDVQESWLRLAPMAYEAGQLQLAGLAAEHALALTPDDPQAQLVAAYVHYRAGHLAQSESLYAVAWPHLPETVRARLDNIEPLLGESARDRYSFMTPGERTAYEQEFWRAHDPDPTTPIHEGWLEYRSRIAHFLMLMASGDRVTWDVRAELYARYGAPDEIVSRPSRDERTNRRPPTGVDAFGLERMLSVPARYPKRVMTWRRPELGIELTLEDLAMLGNFRTLLHQPEVRANAVAMANPEMLAVHSGQAMFRTLSPNARPLGVAGTVHAFPAAGGSRLFTFVTAPGSPVDTLLAECVVLDADAREVSRHARWLGASACDPTSRRTAEFVIDLPPGEYGVTVAVSDGRGGRGVLRHRRSLDPPSPALTVSDVVVVCRPPETAPTSGVVVLDPDPDATPPAGAPLSVYFEISGLSRDARGESQVEITTTATPVAANGRVDRRRIARGRSFVNARTEAAFVGDVRRQFLSVPLGELPPGRWRLDVRVRDSRTGAEQARRAGFTKNWP